MTLGIGGDAAWATKTYGEVREIAERDGSVLVVPVGSLEQHGYHLPVATDSLLVTAIAERALAEEASDVPALVTPTIWTGHSPHHMPFGGTVTLDAEEFLDLLAAVSASALDNGFDALLLLNGHGGNISLIDTATGIVGGDHPDVEVTGLTYFQLAGEAVEEIRDTEIGGMGHGGEFETSLMLTLYPDLVDEDRLEGTTMDEPYDLGIKDLTEGGPLSVYRPFTEYTESGAIGDPTVASAEKGDRLADALAGELGELLGEIHRRNR